MIVEKLARCKRYPHACTCCSAQESGRADWVARYRAGSSLREIAKEAGCSYRQVRKHLLKEGVSLRSQVEKGSRTPWHAEAVQMRQAGMTFISIAAAHGVAWQTVQRAVERGTEAVAATETVRRTCLTCSRVFESEGAGHRICRVCKETSGSGHDHAA